MSPCVFYHCLKSKRVRVKKCDSFRKLYMMSCVYQSLMATPHCIFYILYQQQIFQTYQKQGLLIQCLWQYNKKEGARFLVSNKQYIIENCQVLQKTHKMIYCINYHHVGSLLLSLQMQPHSKADLRIYLAKMKVLLTVINIQYSIYFLFPFFCLCSGAECLISVTQN